MSQSVEQQEEHFCRVMEATERYLEVQEQVAELFKKGFFELAQAKYAVGIDNVGPLKYSTEMTATATFALIDEDGEWVLEERRASGSATEQGDPLKWFGMTVPPSLRQAQGSFSSLVPLLVEMANQAHVMHKATCFAELNE